MAKNQHRVRVEGWGTPSVIHFSTGESVERGGLVPDSLPEAEVAAYLRLGYIEPIPVSGAAESTAAASASADTPESDATTADVEAGPRRGRK